MSLRCDQMRRSADSCDTTKVVSRLRINCATAIKMAWFGHFGTAAAALNYRHSDGGV
jgi:hypothetical protein